MTKQVAHITSDGIKESKKSSKRKSNRRPAKPVQQYRKEIEQEIAATTTKHISFEVFEKTKAEKEQLKAMKKLYKKKSK